MPSAVAARSARGRRHDCPSDDAAMIVLDTDVVSDLMRPRPTPSLVARLGEVPYSEQATTAVTVGELAYGAHRVDRPDLFERAMSLLSDTRVLAFDDHVARHYGRIRSELERQGKRLDDPDLRIAATVLAHEATLITGDTRHFQRVPGLRHENWLR
jgi:tRNA(fMet)-specific endonuclease VapC